MDLWLTDYPEYWFKFRQSLMGRRLRPSSIKFIDIQKLKYITVV